MDGIYERFKKLDLDYSLIGFEQCESFLPYYCTPENAHIIGCAGVDGIHYCTVPDFGDMIFAVNPTNFGDCIHPIARNFEDLLRMLLFTGDMAAIEQCHAWDEKSFTSFLAEYPAFEDQQTILRAVQKEFDLEPMSDTFDYIKKLQSEFDLSEITFTEDYYDLDMNPAVPADSTEWKVTYDGSFWHSDGEAGTEIKIDKTFYWGSEKWYIPAVYICDKGLVTDYFMEADPTAVKAFIDKWELYNEESHNFTAEQQNLISRENPIDISFHGQITCNGKLLREDHGCGLSWIPKSCIAADFTPEIEAMEILEHYGLDTDRAWAIHRACCRWVDAPEPDINSLSVKMIRERENITARHFFTPDVGESVSIIHPLNGKKYCLTVHDIEGKKLPENAFPDSDMETPNFYTAISYSLSPDTSGRNFMLSDSAESDRPRLKESASQSNSVGIIGGADGPTAVFLGNPNSKTLRCACSALHFEPVDRVEWRAVFSEKLMEDITVELISPEK